MNQNWEKIEEEVVYDGYRKVIQKTFKMPDGQIVDYEVMKIASSVCIFALTADRKVILAKQYRVGPEKVLLELPGGGFNEGESAKEAGERELLEETGYSGIMIDLGQSYDSAYNTRIRHSFLATDCRKTAEPQNDAKEPIEVVLLSMDEFMDHLHSGELTDSETAYRALEYLNQNK